MSLKRNTGEIFREVSKKDPASGTSLEVLNTYMTCRP